MPNWEARTEGIFPWENYYFVNNGPVFNDFGALSVHFPAVFATGFAVVRPIKPDCYHCLRIHIFVWKKCTTVVKRQIGLQGVSGACGHWKIFICILDILGIFQPQFSFYLQSITLIGVNGRVGKETCSGKICF